MLKAFSVTDIGRKRIVNQDLMFASTEPVGNLPNIFIVADGMGGHNAGDYASKYAVETIVEEVKKSQESNPKEILQNAIMHTNRLLYRQAQEDVLLNGMGTTVVAATVVDGQILVANVGDSRCYCSNVGISQVTIDHSVVEEMVRLGGITRDEARNHPYKNKITRAVGVENQVEIDFFNRTVEKNDQYLLCSDGLTNMIEDEEIYKILQQDISLEAKVNCLIEEANNRGGNDNITVVIIEWM